MTRRRDRLRALRRHALMIAPPGTLVDDPGWRVPPPGTTLTWTVSGQQPEVAVRRGNVLLATGLPRLLGTSGETCPEPPWMAAGTP